MNGWRAWLHLEVWLAIAAWVMLFVAMVSKAAKAERGAQMREALRKEMKA